MPAENRRYWFTMLSVVAALGLAGSATAEAPAKPSPAPSSKPALPPARTPAEKLADRVQAVYDKATTFRATFTQKYTARVHGKTKVANGSVIFQKPGKMSWRYASNGNRVVSDGKIIKVYEKGNNQMFEQPLGKSAYPAALSFLVGQGSLRQAFELTLLDAKAMNFPGGHVLQGVPRDTTPAYEKMLVYVDGATYQVRRVILLDAQGNKNRFDFSSTQVNVLPPPGEFTFTPPAHTQIIRP